MKRLIEQINQWPLPLLALFIAAYLYCSLQLLFSAWVTEDAYITFRVVDNLVNGYGLRWNVGERVQAYSNPLWLFVHVPFYAMWPNIFLLTIILSFIFSLAAIAVGIKIIGFKPLPAAVFMIVLSSSKAWREFAISGLENPLSFFLAGLFLLYFLKPDFSRRQLCTLSFITALAALNRLDMLVFLAPCWGFIIWQLIKQKNYVIKPLLLGALPLILWFAFSFFYYGFLFPNTKYAKLNTGIETLDYIKQGLWYVVDFIVTDLVGFALITSAALITLSTIIRWRAANDTAKKMALFAAGTIIYCGYTVVIGGDFMTGRFFSLPVYAAAIVVLFILHRLSGRLLLTLTAATIVCAFVQPMLTQKYWRPCFTLRCMPHGIADERGFFLRNTLIKQGSYALRTQPEFVWAQWGRNLKAENRTEPYRNSAIGMQGYYGGAEVVHIDRIGLSDALIARLPMFNPKHFRPGHYFRAVPDGYEYAIKTGFTIRMEPSLAVYYEKLRFIISGELWDMERIKTAILFNFGAYDSYKQQYLTSGLINNDSNFHPPHAPE